MPRMTGGQALAESLVREGVRVIFGLPGVQLYHATDAIYQRPEIRFISARHEQGAAYLAGGYAQASRQVGTALVVPGPGVLNASTALGNAYATSSPLLLIAGQVERDRIGFRRGALHEIHDQLDVLRPITKWACRVLDPAEIPGAVRTAFVQLRTGRPRPVEIEIPPETLSEESEIELVEPAQVERPVAEAGQIKEAARILANAANPLVWAGGGVIASGASEALQRVAEHLQAPVSTTNEGKGSISDRHELCIGAFRMRQDPIRERLAEFDVILAVGTRVAAPRLPEGPKVVQIDVDAEEIGRNHRNTFGVLGDARRSLEELYRVLATIMPPRPSRSREVAALRAERFAPSQFTEPQHSFMQAIRAAMPEAGILVPDMTQVSYYCHAFYPTYQPGTYLTSSYFGNLGYAFPTALGVKVACPDRAVVAICGDGGFLYNSQELATAVQYGIHVVAVVFNDNAYGNVLRDQMNRFDGRVIGTRLHNPDFVALARAYGARGIKAEGAAALESALREALAVDVPTVIEVPVGPMPSPFR